MMRPSKATVLYLLKSNTQANQVHSPFPFMKLPAEIRNKIYRLTATINHSDRLDRHYIRKVRPHNLIYSLVQDAIVQPGLVCCSKQTRSEGLLIFFQEHHFLFDVRRIWGVGGPHSIGDLLPWLNKIGPVERKNIRNITLLCEVSPRDVPVMHRIHAKLSDDATVVYKSPFSSMEMPSL